MKRIRITVNNSKKFSFGDSFFSVGSCFSENAAKYLSSFGVKTFSNPFGTVYNPYSVYQQFLHITEKEKYNADDLSFYNEKFFLFCHSALDDSTDRTAVLNAANSRLITAKDFFAQSGVFLVTLGSAVVYEADSAAFGIPGIHEKIITANCHRVPQSKMARRVLTHAECCTYINKIIETVTAAKPDANIILTVSPARHYPGEPLLDSVSKARLKSATEQVLENYDSKQIFYFPAYEIFRDELCDRKWYKNDAAHPNKKAVSFIMKRFIETSFTDEVECTMNEIAAIRQLLRHRPSSANGIANYELLKKISSRLENIKFADTQTLRFETSCRIAENFYNDKESGSLIEKLLPESDKKAFIFDLMAYFRHERSFESLPTQLFSDKRLSYMLISFLTKNSV